MTVISDDEFVRLFQERFALTVDGWAGKSTIDKLNQLRPPSVVKADVDEIPDEYWPMLSKIESGDRMYIKAPTSSGSGLYQFIRATWLGEGGSWGPNKELAFGGLKPTREEQTQRARSFTAKNAAYLRQKGIGINCASLYAAHFFGPVTAAKVILGDVKANAGALAGDAATKANKSILTREVNGVIRGATVGEFLTWLHKKTGAWAR